MFDGGQRAIHDAPKVDVKEPPMVLVTDLVELTEDRNAGVVDPGIEAAEVVDSRLRDSLDILGTADIGDDMGRLATGQPNVVLNCRECLAVAGGENEPG